MNTRKTVLLFLSLALLLALAFTSCNAMINPRTVTLINPTSSDAVVTSYDFAPSHSVTVPANSSLTVYTYSSSYRVTLYVSGAFFDYSAPVTYIINMGTVELLPNVAWIRFVNNTSNTLEWAKFGDFYFNRNSINGSASSSHTIAPGASKYLKVFWESDGTPSAVIYKPYNGTSVYSGMYLTPDRGELLSINAL